MQIAAAMTTSPSSRSGLALVPAVATAFGVAIAAGLAAIFPLSMVALYVAILPVPLLLLWWGRDVVDPMERILAVDAERAKQARLHEPRALDRAA